ncbi:PBSX family phage terminase large subunit [Clostridium sp. 'White wine YQ']|uniref:PBSX family phage terminase large subunit n=1 Tax=Clostridium sp. 'White wine YQ' TaxID=3027474 RepID=UPI0023662A66|nr:PBSX family phage terminase large subunit [Clostridium sp. 'White wine YQ']MDD7793683.1 PBSX family phage terminase large subunit [Clostridium sp. 'White wine YQ']
MISVSLKEIVASSFYDIHKDLKNGLHTHYWLKGGRGSTKSSFISIQIVLGIMRDAQVGNLTNAVVIRRVKDTLRGSVYEQITWAIYALGVEGDWEIPDSKLQITYKPTGQVILFKGADKPKKLKSTKVAKGYIKYIWYEEVDEFEGKEKLDNINQSLMRGGPKFIVFYSFNPPASQRSWCNEEVLEVRSDKIVHHSDYLAVPREWLGEQFILEAEHMKETRIVQYEHDYLGKVTGTGRDIFDNVIIGTITDDEIKKFDRVYNGVDWGWFPDPWAFNRMHYDAARKNLYIFDEAHENKKSNKATYDILVNMHSIKPNDKITCDSAENKSIEDYKSYGLFARGAVKGPGSVEYSMKWLQSLNNIIIDNKRCPHTAKEFLKYEHEIDKDGNIISGYPDKDNHHIDAVRYGLEEIWRRRGQ